MTTKLDIAGDWNYLKSRIQSKWSQLSDEVLERSKEGMDTLVSTISKGTGEARETVQGYLNACMDQSSYACSKASDAVRYGAKAVSDSAVQLGDTIRSGATMATKRVQERPVESLLMTLGIGVAAGLFLSMLMRSNSRY